MNPVVDDHHLALYFANSTLIREFIEQLNKDIGVTPMDLEKEGEPLLESIHFNLTEKMSRLFREQPSELMNILYRTDLSENQINRALEEEKEATYPEVLSLLLIKRILQKVVTRNYFKKQDL